MKKMIEYLKRDLNRYHLFLYEMVSEQDYGFFIRDLESFIAEVNTFHDEYCTNEEDKTTLLQIKQTAENYRERAKELQKEYCTKKKEEEKSL